MTTESNVIPFEVETFVELLDTVARLKYELDAVRSVARSRQNLIDTLKAEKAAALYEVRRLRG